MKTEQRTVTTIIADEGKILRRKSDGQVAGEQVTLGYNYYESGVGLAQAKLETTEDYEEFDKPEDYEDPVIIDQSRRIVNMHKIVDETKEQINTFGLSNNDALKVKDFYPLWSADSVEVKKGERYQCDNLLWEVVQNHTTQELWKPSLETASLWKVVDEEHAGTQEDPIPYNPPMEIFKDKYYTQNEVLYKCTRNSEIPLSHDLSALVGTYVETVI